MMKIWQTRSLITWLLAPFSLLFWLISQIRVWLYRANWLKSYRAPLPVLVVGNISVGGNGKTPAVIWLVEQLQQHGIRAGVISRGYGGKNKVFPKLVTPNSDPALMGDEPVLIAQRTRAPVAISPNRRESIELLLSQFELDLIITDDGLQHYALQRDFEWVIVDGVRLFGNGFVLPAGGLRELPSRLNRVNAVIYNGNPNPEQGFSMVLKAENAVNLCSGELRAIRDFEGQPWVAMAGIGNPNRFFITLQQYLTLDQTDLDENNRSSRLYAFADHQAYTLEMLKPLANADQPLLMTEKDAVKCRAFAEPNWWFVPVEADFPIAGQREQLLAPIFALIKNTSQG